MTVMLLIFLILTMQTQPNLFGWTEEAPEDVDSKVCIKCGINKPLSEYSIANNQYLRTSCKKCMASDQRVRKRLHSKVGMPPDDHTCPICQQSAKEVAGYGGLKAGPWVLDHCHTNHVFRGWLCHNCNRALGLLKDNKDRLQRAINYLGS